MESEKSHGSHKHMPNVREGVRFGLAGIKNLGSDTVEALINERVRARTFFLID
jgi:DNA polymerase III alpha subunit